MPFYRMYNFLKIVLCQCMPNYTHTHRHARVYVRHREKLNRNNAKCYRWISLGNWHMYTSDFYNQKKGEKHYPLKGETHTHLIICKSLACPRHCSQHLMRIISLRPLHYPVRMVPFITIPILQIWKWKPTQLASDHSSRQ